MTDFPTLLYPSTSEIATLSYTSSLKKIPLPGGASPYRPSYGESPPRAPRAQDQACVLGPVHTNTEKNVGF